MPSLETIDILHKQKALPVMTVMTLMLSFELSDISVDQSDSDFYFKIDHGAEIGDAPFSVETQDNQLKSGSKNMKAIHLSTTFKVKTSPC